MNSDGLAGIIPISFVDLVREPLVRLFIELYSALPTARVRSKKLPLFLNMGRGGSCVSARHALVSAREHYGVCVMVRAARSPW